MSKLLAKLDGNAHRTARFRTVVALILDGKEYTFEGIAEGNIAEERSGAKGFGYDPIFIPNGFSQTFAELDSIVKNKISHRGKAISKVLEFFNTK
jgi:XTP/dITP diphosphohydrolase